MTRPLPFLLAAAVACSAPCGCSGRPPAPAAASPSLPDVIPSWSAGPLQAREGYVRRTYTRGAARVTVTLARYQMSPDQYDEWVRTSEAGYPQAALDVAPGSGNGFYQCAEQAPSKCDLLIQLRAGAHLEVRGEGAATRADVEALARGLPLRSLAAGAR